MAIDEARKLGATESEVGISVDTGLSVTARLGEVETLEYQRDRGMGITVYRGKRKGSASTGDLRPQAIRETVAKAFLERITSGEELEETGDRRETLDQRRPDRITRRGAGQG